jgi:hypothetical protein
LSWWMKIGNAINASLAILLSPSCRINPDGQRFK